MNRNDRSTRVLLGIIAGLLALNLVAQTNTEKPAVAAGIPDSGAQFQAMVDSLKDIGKKLDKMQTLLESGSLGVKVKEMPKAEK